MSIKNVLKKSMIVRLVYFKAKAFGGYIKYLNDYFSFNKLLMENMGKTLAWKDRYVCIDDKTSTTAFDTHYVYHTAWAARKLKEIAPQKHIDISSSIYFNAITSAFIPIEFYDYRPANINLTSLYPKSADLLSLPFSDQSIKSLSCMHVLEHIGLGRYGDSLDTLGDMKAVSELIRVLDNNGDLLIVVPVGKSVINYNAHRVYGYEEIIKMFSKLTLVEFSLLTDDDKGAEFIINSSSDVVKKQRYGCGCFWFKKMDNEK